MPKDGSPRRRQSLLSIRAGCWYKRSGCYHWMMKSAKIQSPAGGVDNRPLAEHERAQIFLSRRLAVFHVELRRYYMGVETEGTNESTKTDCGDCQNQTEKPQGPFNVHVNWLERVEVRVGKPSSLVRSVSKIIFTENFRLYRHSGAQNKNRITARNWVQNSKSFYAQNNFCELKLYWRFLKGCHFKYRCSDKKSFY